LKKKKGNMGVRELFNKQLGNVEVLPDTDLEMRLMRKLARKEFVRFIPSRFNIYYLGGIVSAGILSVLVLINPKSELSIPVAPVAADSIIINDQRQIGQDSLRGESIDLNNTDVREKGLIILNSEKSSSGVKGSELEIINSEIPDKPDIVLQNDSKQETIVSDFKSVIPDLPSNAEYTVARIEMSSTEGCLPLKIKFFNASVNFDSCIWSFGDGGSSSVVNPEWIFDEEGVYRISLTVFGKNGFKSVTRDSLTVYQKPQARFETTPENAIIPKDEIRFMNYSSDAVNYRWEFGDGTISEDYEPVHQYENSGRYNVQLIVKSEYGCTDSLVVENAFAGSSYYITFPNAFIPNSGGPSGGYYSSKSDESAQVFHPYSSAIAEYQLRIFSKLGILIFESNDINIGWDGYYKSQLSEPGVYIWKVRGKFNNGEPFVKMGDVLLLKD
jgi:PKD repeat protein